MQLAYNYDVLCRVYITLCPMIHGTYKKHSLGIQKRYNLFIDWDLEKQHCSSPSEFQYDI